MRRTLVETRREVGLSLTANMEYPTVEGSSTGPTWLTIASPVASALLHRSASKSGRSAAAKGTGLQPEARRKLEQLSAV